MRNFEKISIDNFKKNNFNYLYEEIKLPQRATKYSAGYDFFTIDDVVIEPKQNIKVPTGIRAFMNKDEYLQIAIRSSLCCNYGIKLSNGIAVIDSDYVNSANEGHIYIFLYNSSEKTIEIPKGAAIAQGIFLKYYKTVDEEEVLKERIGGLGSTSKPFKLKWKRNNGR